MKRTTPLLHASTRHGRFHQGRKTSALAVVAFTELSVGLAASVELELVGHYDTIGPNTGAYVIGDVAYITEWYAGLTILDVTIPSNPTLLGTCDGLGLAHPAKVSGQYAYVPGHDAGLQIVEVGVPNAPSWVAALTFGYPAEAVHIVGDLAYVASHWAGLRIVDISLPQVPQQLGYCSLGDECYDVAVREDIAYVAAASSGLKVVDVSDPAQPLTVGSCDTPGRALGVGLGGSLACIGDEGGGLQVLEIAQLTGPIQIGAYDTGYSAVHVQVVGQYAYVAAGGVQVIDIGTPTSPVLAGEYITGTNCEDLCVRGNLVYLAGVSDGFLILRIKDNAPPDCSAARAVPDCLWPPNHQFVSVAISGVEDRDGDAVTIRIDGITSDEPTASDRGSGGRKYAPDAWGIGAGASSLRAERSGLGDGRVYVIHFTASDEKGGEGVGSVVVRVPHEWRLDRGVAVDSGQLYDATEAD